MHEKAFPYLGQSFLALSSSVISLSTFLTLVLQNFKPWGQKNVSNFYIV